MSAIPSYLSKLSTIKKDMRQMTDQMDILKRRAARLKQEKRKRIERDRQLMARPAASRLNQSNSTDPEKETQETSYSAE